MTLVAGVAQVEITPDPGVPLMGYGAREGVSTGVHDPLYARALYLDSGGSAPPREGALLLAADLCLMGAPQAGEVRERIALETGLEPCQILVSCTHTHSGPETGLAALIAGRPLPPHCAALQDGLVAAGLQAASAPRAARLAWGRAEVAIGRNRRLADGPIDPGVLVLRVDGEDGRPRAVLFSHGCHSTVLGYDNLEISADWPGVAAERVASETGALALFLLGAHADIDPRTRGLMDLATPGQSLGLGFEAVRVLGLEVADAVLDVLDAMDPPNGSDPPVRAAHTRVALPLHLGELAPERAREQLEARKHELCDLLEVPPDRFPRLSQLGPFVESRVRNLPLAETRRRLSLARLYLRDKTAPFLVGGGREFEVEAQVMRIGDAALLALPLEPTTNVGLDWRTRAARALPFAGVAGIANGWLQYLPHPDDLAHPRANEHYEVLQSTFAPGACERLLDAGEALLATLT